MRAAFSQRKQLYSLSCPSITSKELSTFVLGAVHSNDNDNDDDDDDNNNNNDNDNDNDDDDNNNDNDNDDDNDDGNDDGGGVTFSGHVGEILKRHFEGWHGHPI